MSILGYPSTRSTASSLDALEDDFLDWLHDPVMPEVIAHGLHGEVAMVDLCRHLAGSQTKLGVFDARRVGLPSGATIGTAAAALLHSTVDPQGPRCRSFRAARYYLRGLANLDTDLPPATSDLDLVTEAARGYADVR